MLLALVAVLLAWGQDPAPARTSRLIRRFAAGAVCGLAVLGRQPFVILLVLLPAFGARHWGDLLRAGLPIFLGAALFIVPVFALWGGIVPPHLARVDSHLVPAHGVLALAYAALLMLFLAPRWLALPVMPAAAAAGALGLTAVGLGIRVYPAGGWAARWMEPAAMDLYGAASALALGCLAGWFLLALCSHIWQARRDRNRLLFLLVACGVLLSCAKISHLFSSRYVLPAMPFLFVAARPFATSTRLHIVLQSVGALIGLALLWGYYGTAS